MIKEIIVEINKVKYQYQILKFLGEGSQSKVYKCKRKGEFQFYAVKVFSKKLLEDKNNFIFRDLVNNEYMIHKDLDHPNILKLFDYGKDEKYYYFFFDFCEGGSIMGKKLNPEKIKLYFSQIISALIYLKEKKVLHLDIKPENILIKNDKVKLCDFGLSVKLGAKDYVDGIKRGTLDYMSPEILNFSNVSYETDLWSSVIVLCYMNFKISPFRYHSKNDDDKSYTNDNDMIEDNIKYRDEYLPKCSDSNLIDLIQNTLEKDPENRLKLDEILNHPYLIL